MQSPELGVLPCGVHPGRVGDRVIGDTLWAWQVQEPDGQWSMVGALLDGRHTPLIHRKYDVVLMMASMAKTHSERTGQPLRLAEFVLKNQWVEEAL